MRYYTTTQLSEHLQETPEGYLLCLDVPIARLGEQVYKAEEVPDVTPGPDGLVRARREPEEVFSPASIASFEGKSITLLHPANPDKDPEDEDSVEFVTPDNWKELSCGVGLNIRRGEGEFADVLLADLLVTDADAIAAVRGGLRQVSCGYDADTEEIEPGLGRQVGIVGNHIALVPRGRAGARCSIRDALTLEIEMPEQVKKKGFWDRVFDSVKRGKTIDEAAAEALKDEGTTPPPARPEGPAPAAGSGDLAGKLDEILLLLHSIVEKSAPPKPADGEPPHNVDAELEEEEEKKPGKIGDAAPRGTRLADAETVRRSKILAPNIAARVGDADRAVKKAFKEERPHHPANERRRNGQQHQGHPDHGRRLMRFAVRMPMC
jgi:hypothetical protein